MPNSVPDTVRIGIFSRWHHGGDDGDMERYRRDMPRPMWKYWEGEALKAVVGRGSKL